MFVNVGEVEDTSPSLDKVEYIPERNVYLIRSIRGLRIQATRRLDDTGGFDVSRIGPYRVSSSASVAFSDPAVILALKPQALLQADQDASVQLAFSDTSTNATFTLKAAMAAFGPHIREHLQDNIHSLLDLTSFSDNVYGCEAYTASSAAVLVRRGVCTFASKMKAASEAGAPAVLILSDEEQLLVPSAEESEVVSIPTPIPLVLLPKSAADQLTRALEQTTTGLKMHVESSSAETASSQVANELAQTPVIINGYWMVNCRLERL